MDGFIAEANQKLYSAYQTLWPTPPDVTKEHSVLEIL